MSTFSPPEADLLIWLFLEPAPTKGGGAAKERAFATRRVYKKDVVNSVTTELLYLHDGMNAIVERNKTGTPTEYIYGPTGIIAIKTPSSTNFILKDHLGSTRVLLNSSNAVISTYDYSAFGILTPPSSSAYLYTGQEWDQTSGLHNFKARMYDSDLAMFYGADPAGEGASPFAYVGNNPLTRRDPSGNFIQLAAIAYYAYKAYQVYTIARAVYGIYQATKYGGIGGFVQGLTAAGISYGIGSVAGGFAGGAGVPTLAGSIRGGIASRLAGGTLGAHAAGGRARLGWNTVFDAGVGAAGGALAYGSQVHTANQAAKASNRDPRAPVPFEQEELDNVIDESEQLSTMRDRGGNPSAKIVNSANLAETGTDNYEAQGGNLINKTTGESVGAKTFDVRGSSFYREDGSIGSRSQILVSRQASQAIANCT